jgi:hypothetical protein
MRAPRDCSRIFLHSLDHALINSWETPYGVREGQVSQGLVIPCNLHSGAFTPKRRKSWMRADASNGATAGTFRPGRDLESRLLRPLRVSDQLAFQLLKASLTPLDPPLRRRYQATSLIQRDQGLTKRNLISTRVRTHFTETLSHLVAQAGDSEPRPVGQTGR